jgi:mannose-6-phosphate isomerase
MDLYPIKLTFHINPYIFGERRIADLLGKRGLPEGKIAETWEISSYKDKSGIVTNGRLAGHTLNELVKKYPDELVGKGWDRPHFPILEKFIDASGMLPIHLHADDDVARRKYGEPNGKTEAWHILWARSHATALAGVRPGVTRNELRDAFEQHYYDSVMTRFRIKAGDTIYVPGGVLHSFGPGTLVFEVQQTSDLSQDVMPTDMQGNNRTFDDWMKKIDDTLDELCIDYQPHPHAGLALRRKGGNQYKVGCAGAYFALERWKLIEPHQEPPHPQRCLTLSNVGSPLRIEYDGGSEILDRAESCIIPATLRNVYVSPTKQSESADLIACYVPDLQREIVEPLRAAGHSDIEIASLGKVPL